MEIANIRLRLAKVGNDVPVIGVTPFEAVLLHVLHGANNGGSSYGDKMDAIELGKEPAKTLVTPAEGEKGKPGYKEATYRDRTNIEEYNRLKVKYGSVVNKKGDKIVGLVWAGLAQNPPQKFSDIKWSDVQFDGVEVAPLNYATGGQVVTAAPGK